MISSIVLKGVKVTGDFDEVKKVKALGASIIIINKENDKVFFVNHVNKRDEVSFDFKDNLAVFKNKYEGSETEIKSIPKTGIAKQVALEYLPALIFFGLGGTLMLIGQNEKIDPYEIMMFSGGFLTGMGLSVCTKKKIKDFIEKRTINKLIKNKALGIEVPKDEMELKGFYTVESRIGKEVVKENEV